MCEKDRTLMKTSVLAKITSIEYAKDLMNGNLYCNSLDYFRNNGNKGQKDAEEGIAFYYKDLCQNKIDFNKENIYLYCMYILYSTGYFFDKNGQKQLHYKMPYEDSEKFKLFFTNIKKVSSVTVYKVDDFIRRIIDFCHKESIDFCHSCVEYYDLRHPSKEMNQLLAERPMTALFCKNPEFESQKEYRFVFFGENTKKYINSQGALVLPLGSITDEAVQADNIFGK